MLQANDWCLAVTHSTAVIYEDSGGAVGRVLKEATWIFELAGIGLFAGATYTTTQVTRGDGMDCSPAMDPYRVEKKHPKDDDTMTTMKNDDSTHWICQSYIHPELALGLKRHVTGDVIIN